ncbi:Homeobox protein knotted-1-like 3 [Hibiscus syriacus]|uniref:Homeobox protein knotted-1-like 3 n=1 Tax=Hibiscus syriacus TaxID=106335 RepID=A0A6A2WDX9_HIBSY|nr:Homeobox protein knotted-1-like 3 [Hibiscus syriacus]
MTSRSSSSSSALLRQPIPQAHFSDPNFLNLHTTTTNASEPTSASRAPNQWLSRSSSSFLQHNHGDAIRDMAAVETVGGGGVDRESMVAVESGELERSNSELNNNNKSQGFAVEGGGGEGTSNWQNARYKAKILAHPLYEQLLSAHVACLRTATPVDQLPRIDAQLATSQQVVAKYSALDGGAQGLVGDEKELDLFMTHYVLLLCSFKEQLQQHVRVHAMEAVMACWEIEQSLQSLTGVSPGEGTGATMSDDDEDQNSNMNSNRVTRRRLRTLGKKFCAREGRENFPGDTTSVLKAWWQSHSKWPYPTEEDKARLVQETGLQLKQINNWFINQRKRNWHSNPSTSTVSKNKRKK